MIGPDGTPTASMTVQFNAFQPNTTLDSFRFNGTTTPDNNGFVIQIDALGSGDITIQAVFEDLTSGSYSWHLLMKKIGGDSVFDKTGDPSQTVAESQAVDQASYKISLTDPDEVANPGASVIVTATISWP